MRTVLFFLCVSLIQTPALVASETSRFHHPGRLIDASGGAAITDARVAAFRTNDGRTGDDCPAYRDSLSVDTRTGPDGSFVLRVPKELVNFVAVYCSAGYIARTQTINDNSANRTPLAPKPIRLLPRNVSVQLMRASLSKLRSDMTWAIEIVARDYPTSFQSAIASLSPADRRFIRSVRANENATRPQIDGSRAAEKLRAISKAAMLDLDYFATAAPDAFRDALRHESELREYYASTRLQGEQ
jgi:hypothetical protein